MSEYFVEPDCLDMKNSTETTQMTSRIGRTALVVAAFAAIGGSFVPDAAQASNCPCGGQSSAPSSTTPTTTGSAEQAPTETQTVATSTDSTLTGSASLTIDGGSASTMDPTLHLSLVESGLGSGSEMRFSIDGGTTWTPSVPFAATADLPLPPKKFWGTINVKAQLTDAAGTTAAATASIAYQQAQRSTMTLAPRYLLKAALDYANARLTTTETVDVTNNSKSVVGYLDFSVLARHFGEMNVRTVTVDTRTVTATYPNESDLRVPLGYNLRPGESARAVLTFDSFASSDISTSLAGRFSKANGVMQISSWHPVLSDGHGFRYPGDSQYTVAASYRLELTHPSSVVIAAPGALVSSTTTTKVYTLNNAREFAFAASPSFTRTSATTASGVRVLVTR